MLLFGMINFTYTWYDAKGAVKPKAFAEMASDLFLNGFLAKPTTAARGKPRLNAHILFATSSSMTSVAPPPMVRTRVAGHALDRRAAHEARAAVQLQAAVHDLLQDFRRQCLDHRDFADAVATFGREFGCMIGELARRGRLRSEARQFLAHRLLVPEAVAEGAARLDVVDRQFNRPWRSRRRKCRRCRCARSGTFP